MDHRVVELARSRTSLFPHGTGTLWRNVAVINILLPYHIHHLDQFTGYLDVASITIFLSAVCDPIKHRTPPAAGANRTMSGLDKGPLERSVAVRAYMTAQW